MYKQNARKNYILIYFYSSQNLYIFWFFKFQLRFIFYDNIIIRGKDKDIAFTIETMDDYVRIKEFFMKTKGIDLDKAQRHVWLDLINN